MPKITWIAVYCMQYYIFIGIHFCNILKKMTVRKRKECSWNRLLTIHYVLVPLWRDAPFLNYKKEIPKEDIILLDMSGTWDFRYKKWCILWKVIILNYKVNGFWGSDMRPSASGSIFFLKYLRGTWTFLSWKCIRAKTDKQLGPS